jgi:phospholipid transport system transporter-binding protein
MTDMSEVFGIVNQEGRLVVSGDLNFVTVPKVWEQSLLLLTSLPELNFDLEKITFSNSAGLALLIEWMKYAKKSQKKIYFHHIPSQLSSIIKATGVRVQ